MVTIVLTSSDKSIVRLTDGINVFSMEKKLIQTLAVFKKYCKVDYILYS